MMRILLFDGSEVRAGGEALIDQWKQDPETSIWVDLDGTELERERRLMRDVFAINELAVSDALRERHPPKLELFDDYLFVLLKGLDAETIDLDFQTIQIALFIGERFLLTRHSRVSRSTNQVWDEAKKNPRLFTEGPASMAMALCRYVVDRYLPILLNLETRLETLEEEMFERPRDELLAELSGYKTNLKKLRRIFIYHDQVFNQLKREPPPQIPQALRHRLVDVYEHQERVNSLSNLYYELASDLVDGYISLASHRLNQIMKVLTIITAIFVPLSFLAGVYGMNFDNMPELHSSYGYYVLLGVMTAIVAALIAVFRKVRWL